MVIMLVQSASLLEQVAFGYKILQWKFNERGREAGAMIGVGLQQHMHRYKYTHASI